MLDLVIGFFKEYGIVVVMCGGAYFALPQYLKWLNRRLMAERAQAKLEDSLRL
ncbi:hypothetical protein P9250_21685 [Caballeronia sp. LP006]|jgi:hypothetical protein|uniref:hypothetical protein n=1 Tax=unclassified Caballeronia TaxID=2646786 RepID=UPI002028E016|nr:MULTISPECIES: hypothetical protein [unclassified Caballeronia]MDR5830491.1 hypothetical protein [Caballeronia sp. LP006]